MRGFVIFQPSGKIEGEAPEPHPAGISGAWFTNRIQQAHKLTDVSKNQPHDKWSILKANNPDDMTTVISSNDYHLFRGGKHKVY